jgi:phenylacetate-CoA ligase
MPGALHTARSVDGIVWPTLTTGTDGLARGLEEFAVTERLRPEELKEHQFSQLAELLSWTYRKSAYYRPILASVGFELGKQLTREVWQRLPVLERASIQADGPKLRQQPPPGHGRTLESSTSGSTGRPITAAKTDFAMLLWALATLRDHEWHRRDYLGTMASIRWFPDGAHVYPTGGRWPNWGTPVHWVRKSGPSFALSIAASAAEQAEWLGRIQPNYLLLFPSLIVDLARECDAQGIELPNLRHVRTLGEQVDRRVRDLCAERWGVPVHDLYSAQEVGCIALQCSDHEHYHVSSESVLVEILRADGSPCALGEVGRVVVTPLHNFAMPLIRYAIGDYASWGEACSCGRGLPVLSQVHGRSRNMLVLPDGRRVWPRLSELRYADVLPVTQFQVIQKSLTRLVVRLVSSRPGTTKEEDHLRALIASRIGHDFEMAFEYPAAIQRSAGGKFEDFKSELAVE